MASYGLDDLTVIADVAEDAVIVFVGKDATIRLTPREAQFLGIRIKHRAEDVIKSIWASATVNEYEYAEALYDD